MCVHRDDLRQSVFSMERVHEAVRMFTSAWLFSPVCMRMSSTLINMHSSRLLVNDLPFCVCISIDLACVCVLSVRETVSFDCLS